MVQGISIIITLFLLIKEISSQNLYATKYSMSDVKNFNIVKCRDDSDCPSYSNGCYQYDIMDEGYCNVYFICHQKKNDYCYVIGTPNPAIKDTISYEYPYYNITDREPENLIITTCDRESILNHKCLTEFCFRHNECFSNHCYLGNCETDEENPAYICTLIASENNNDIENGDIYFIDCKLAKQEQCKQDSDCITYICDDTSGLCVESDESGLFQEQTKDEILGLPSGLVYTIIFIFACVFFGFCCCRIRKRPHTIRLND